MHPPLWGTDLHTHLQTHFEFKMVVFEFVPPVELETARKFRKLYALAGKERGRLKPAKQWE